MFGCYRHTMTKHSRLGLALFVAVRNEVPIPEEHTVKLNKGKKVLAPCEVNFVSLVFLT
jgi:hypothetical protein